MQRKTAVVNGIGKIEMNMIKMHENLTILGIKHQDILTNACEYEVQP